jgi:small subunit ribosomal protein S7
MRRRKAKIRELSPDPKYGSIVAVKFINNLMWDGKRSLSQRLFYGALDLVEEKTGQSGIEVFDHAIDNIKPKLEVRPRRVGGATYQVPVEVRPKRQLSLAIKWLIKAVRSRHEKTITEKLANELIDASKGVGAAIKIKDNAHRMAEANRVFAHFRW